MAVAVLIQRMLAVVFAGLVLASKGFSVVGSNEVLYLSWHAESNVAYQVQHAADLDDGEWSNAVDVVVGAGNSIMTTVTNQTGEEEASHAYFRLAKTYPSAEEAVFQNMLTPVYYNAVSNDAFRAEVDRFVYYAGKEGFHHPLMDGTGQVPSYTVPGWGEFGATKPVMGTPQSYHPASDLQVGAREVAVQLFAAHDGVVAVYRDADKYRHYLAITMDIMDADGVVVGKISTLYGHIDLDLDEADGLWMDGKAVQKGELVSRNLYSGTMGGPHLHFEIRYYRADDAGAEEFYGGPAYSEPSAGPWLYGYWDPQIGYGFADPVNHGFAF
ncbi:hypothetical protein PDESU_03753 [Pontiella desulfatans]|uniref:Peptidase M23 domain-containing protein n=2 Tax=Pontiella desulfatans TaxID=2750659 RepID=A0A6C2U6L6_PONDE|nr:hypothetical protein PDESU_03753 [Pontiella desulfatans]